MPPASDLRRQLERLLKSRTFATRPRSAELIHYFVEESIRNGFRPISQRQIASQGLGLEADASSNRIAAVRVKMGRLRAALDRYYKGPGRRDPVLFAISEGPYRLVATGDSSFQQGDGSTDPREMRRTRPTLLVVEPEFRGVPAARDAGLLISLRLVSRLVEDTLVTVSGPLRRERIPAADDSNARFFNQLGYDFAVETAIRIEPAGWRVRATITAAKRRTAADDATRTFDPEANGSLADDVAAWIHNRVRLTCAASE